MTAAPLSQSEPLAIWRQRCARGSALLSAGAVVAAFVSPTGALRAWLLAFMTWSAVSFGALAIVLLHGVTGGRWGRVLLPYLQTAVRIIPWLAVGFAPIFIGCEDQLIGLFEKFS